MILGLVESEDTDFEQGPALALMIVAAVEGWFISRTSWEKSVEAATARNAMG